MHRPSIRTYAIPSDSASASSFIASMSGKCKSYSAMYPFQCSIWAKQTASTQASVSKRAAAAAATASEDLSSLIILCGEATEPSAQAKCSSAVSAWYSSAGPAPAATARPSGAAQHEFSAAEPSRSLTGQEGRAKNEEDAYAAWEGNGKREEQTTETVAFEGAGENNKGPTTLVTVVKSWTVEE